MLGNFVSEKPPLSSLDTPLLNAWDTTANTKHLYNICTMLDQRRRRWDDIVQMLYKCFVFAGIYPAQNQLGPVSGRYHLLPGYDFSFSLIIICNYSKVFVSCRPCV